MVIQRKELEDEMQRQRDELKKQKEEFAEEQRRKIQSQQDEQHKLLQFQEIDRQLQDVVPKVAELNAICTELGKDNFLYEPEIVTEIRGDGRRESRVVLRVYVDRADKEVFSQLSLDDFSEVVYQRVKDVYEGMFEDDEIQE
jgi:hypothetical protein